MRAGLDSNSNDEFGRTFLATLCFVKNQSKALLMAKILMKHGSKIHISDDKGIALCVSEQSGRSSQTISIFCG